jgi:hypothetical protein
MPTLPLTHADLKRLCAIEDADTSADTDLDALITAQQPVWEYALDPAILTAASTNTGLQATLVLGIAEALAGEWLRRQARAPGSTDDFHVGPLTVTASRTDGLAQIGDRLAAQGVKRLAPFARAAKQVAADALGNAAPDSAAKTPLLAHTSTAGGSPFDLGLDWTALP